MKLQSIPIDQLIVRPQFLWQKQGLLLTCGDFAAGHFNAMTIGWGSLGVMWGLPFVQVVVRPTRYTYEFMEQYNTFTVCGFQDRYYDALQLLGTKSGREGNKIAEARLTPIASTVVASPCYAEAELVLECRKLYWDDMKKENFLDSRIEERYPKHDYHRIYYGEILAVFGTKEYQA